MSANVVSQHALKSLDRWGVLAGHFVRVESETGDACLLGDCVQFALDGLLRGAVPRSGP